jgi:hypothetical protein
MKPCAFSTLAILSSIFLLHSGAAHAQSCGLHSVPLAAPENARTLVLGADLRSAALAGWAGSAGSELRGRFSEIAFQARFSAAGPWSMGWEWPLAILRLGETTRVGFGNPGAYAEYRISAGSRSLFALGAHAGLPLGNRYDGIAGDHFMGAVYATLARVSAGMHLSGTIGTRMALPWMADHGAAAHTADPPAASDSSRQAHAAAASSGIAGMSLGNPHENWELIYRAAVRRDIAAGRFAVLFALEGQRVLSEPMGMGRIAEQGESAARDFLTGESALYCSFGTTEISPHLRIPLSASQRAGWGLGVRISERY